MFLEVFKKIAANRVIVFRHGLVSLFCGSTELTVFAALMNQFPNIIYLNYVTSFSMATFIGFVLHSKYTFSLGDLQLVRGLKFFLQASIVLAFGLTVFTVLIKFNIAPLLSKTIQLALTFSVNIVIGKCLTFSKKTP